MKSHRQNVGAAAIQNPVVKLAKIGELGGLQNVFDLPPIRLPDTELSPCLVRSADEASRVAGEALPKNKAFAFEVVKHDGGLEVAREHSEQPVPEANDHF